MGLDIGDKWIGVALSDPGGILASPLTIVSCKDEESCIAAILEIINRNRVKQMVVGLPLSEDGGLGKQAVKIKTFIEHLSRRVAIPIAYCDERFTTISAKSLLNKKRTRKSRNKGRYDDAAAALILQNYLDERQEVQTQC